MTDSYDAVVVGAGILGAAAGYHVAAAGLRAAVVDRNDPGQATSAGAGIVCPVTATVGDERLIDLAFAAADYYPALAAELCDGGAPTGYQASAMLSVSVGGAGLEQVSRTAAWADRVAGSTNYTALCRYTKLSAPECLTHCSNLSDRVDGGLLIDAAQVDGNEFRNSLLKAGRRLGLTVLNGDVAQVRVSAHDVQCDLDSGETLTAGHAVVCAGAWTERLLTLGNATPVITAARGEILHLQVDGLDTAAWPLVEVEGGGPYIIPWPSGRLAVGTTFESAPDLDARPTLSGIRQIADSLERATGGLMGVARLVEYRVGLRPVSLDGLPVIGRWPAAERVVFATGHGANGLSWGPYTGKLVADMISGQHSGIDLRPFAVDRFEESAGKEQV